MLDETVTKKNNSTENRKRVLLETTKEHDMPGINESEVKWENYCTAPNIGDVNGSPTTSENEETAGEYEGK